MDLFAPLCSSCGECTWCIERVSASSPLQGSRLVVLVVVIVVFFTLLPSLQHRKERTHVGDWAPVAPCALSFFFSLAGHSCPSSSTFFPTIFPLPRPTISFYPPLSCSSPFLPPNSLLDSLISFFRRVSSGLYLGDLLPTNRGLPPRFHTVPSRFNLLQLLSLILLSVQLLSSSFLVLRSRLRPLCFVASRHSDLFLSPFLLFSFAARSLPVT